MSKQNGACPFRTLLCALCQFVYRTGRELTVVAVLTDLVMADLGQETETEVVWLRLLKGLLV